MLLIAFCAMLQVPCAPDVWQQLLFRCDLELDADIDRLAAQLSLQHERNMQKQQWVNGSLQLVTDGYARLSMRQQVTANLQEQLRELQAACRVQQLLPPHQD